MLRSTEDGRRIFNDSAVSEAVNAALAHVSEDKPVAVVAHATPLGQRLSIAVRLGDDWSIMAACYREVRASDKVDLGYGAQVVWTP
jgi:hypothetical protein